MNNMAMLLKGIKYLFFSIYKITSINYGKEGGAYASFVIVSILLSINAITFVGFFNKLILENSKISLLFLGFIFAVLLITNYFFLIHKLKYKSIISYFQTNQRKGIARILSILTYVFVSFLLFVMMITIKTG